MIGQHAHTPGGKTLTVMVIRKGGLVPMVETIPDGFRDIARLLGDEDKTILSIEPGPVAKTARLRIHHDDGSTVYVGSIAGDSFTSLSDQQQKDIMTWHLAQNMVRRSS